MYVYPHVHLWTIYILSHYGVGNDQEWKNTDSNKLYFLSKSFKKCFVLKQSLDFNNGV